VSLRILTTTSAYERVGTKLRQIMPAALFITVAAPGIYACEGLTIAEEDIQPDIVWISHDAWDAKLTDVLMKVALRSQPKWVQGHMAGLDNAWWRRMLTNGTRVTKSIGAAVPIAEYVMAHALSLIVPLDAQRDAQLAHQWIVTPFKEVNGSRWTIVGLGAIGREVAFRALAFGACVTGVRRTPGEDPVLGITYGLDEMPGLLGNADVVVLAIPATRETRRMADARFFAALKPGAILINIARGGLVDLEALRGGLESNKPGRVVLDTFEEEPLDPGSWLWDHPKVRLSAHTSWFGDKNGARMDAQFLENLARFGSGQPLLK
jgi:phosphoglycerate dehydrogenase-like enzyme